MPKINLTPEDKTKLIEAMNNGIEPTPVLLLKLFPGMAEKFDVKALDRAKIPTLEYAGKRSKASILAEAGAGIGVAPLQIVRCFGEAKNGEWKNIGCISVDKLSKKGRDSSFVRGSILSSRREE